MYNRKLTYEEKINFLRVIRTKNVGPISFAHLLNMHKTIGKVIKYLETKTQVFSTKKAIQEMKKITDFGAKLIAFCEPEYPFLLKEIRDFPPLICVKGDISILSHKKLFAVAGSRACSLQSQVITKKIVSELGANGYVIVSGLAKGIDTFAHQNSLETGTIAVLANGIDCIYPSENEELYDKISSKGVLVSEVEFGTKPIAHLFPNRNRIISGMSLGVLISEASIKSGSLITAQCALETGRDVFAIPGCPLDPRSRGANKLIKDGATLVENAQDIMNSFLNFSLRENENIYQAEIYNDNLFEENFNDHKEKVYALVGFLPISIDSIINQIKLPVNIVKTLLVQLEIEGRIKHTWGNKVTLQ